MKSIYRLYLGRAISINDIEHVTFISFLAQPCLVLVATFIALNYRNYCHVTSWA
jgi:K+-transporting ATPase A subunit